MHSYSKLKLFDELLLPEYYNLSSYSTNSVNLLIVATQFFWAEYYEEKFIWTQPGSNHGTPECRSCNLPLAPTSPHSASLALLHVS